MAQAQRGDPEAFRVLYRDIQPRLVRYLRALAGEDAEDVASETWLQVARDLAGDSELIVSSPTELPHRAVIGGDGRSAAIAAASIVAKVTRDRFMHHADELHPGWSFAQHVGYSTPEHRDAILRLGPSPLHRMSFQSVAYAQLELI